MQLMIDVNQEHTPGLRLAAQFLWDHASLRELMEAGVTPNLDSFRTALNIAPPVPMGTTSEVPPVPAAPVVKSPEQIAADAALAAYQAMANSGAPAPSNVVPFVPPAPAQNPTTAPGATTPPASVATLELDATGMPWDGRIHQKAKGKKKGDGTWKLIKGIDPAIVASVTQELHARMINSPPAEVAAPSFPGGVPMPPLTGAGTTPADNGMSAQHNAGAVPVPPPPTNGGVPVPPPPVTVQQPNAVPVPPAPVLGVSDGNGQNLVQPMTLRDLVSKITQLRTAGRLTADQVDGAVRAAGAPNLQTLGAMAHLVPEVNLQIDLILAQS